MAEVLGRYSNQGAAGVSARTVRDVASVGIRDAPWEAPTLVGHTRVSRILAAEMDAIVADYRGGMGCVLLSRKYGIGENTVLARLKEAGVDVRPQGYLEPDTLLEMARLRSEGWTLAALGERYGITRQTVAARLKRSG
ncbi:hypothetical protein [Nocardioides sp.]|uniref:hypothetical protein n=1 Tax=Nocardioides sp. TaxID=35761 RepID=UPI002CA0F848|nr:hypothetical protein [Nocardioides sp.]HSX68041.1 hypothetical protein [Nocardioides sp.]